MVFWHQFRDIWLSEGNWIYCKIYAKDAFLQNWVTANNWYTEVLSRIVKPIVTQYDEIVKATFFGFYFGDYDPTEGCAMDEATSTDLRNKRVLFTRLRICLSKRKDEVKNRLDEMIS